MNIEIYAWKKGWFKMRNGLILKQKMEYFKEKLQTKSGIFDLLISNFIWGFLIITYNQLIFNTLLAFFSFIGWGWLRYYLAYTTFGLALIPVSIGITILTTKTFKFLNQLKRKLF